jgi:hypothetical protein
MNRPTKEETIEFAKRCWKTLLSFRYPPAIADKIHQAYVDDVIKEYDKVSKLSDEDYEKHVQASSHQFVMSASRTLASMENAVNGTPNGTTGFTQNGMDGLDKKGD